MCAGFLNSGFGAKRRGGEDGVQNCGVECERLIQTLVPRGSLIPQSKDAFSSAPWSMAAGDAETPPRPPRGCPWSLSLLVSLPVCAPSDACSPRVPVRCSSHPSPTERLALAQCWAPHLPGRSSQPAPCACGAAGALTPGEAVSPSQPGPGCRAQKGTPGSAWGPAQSRCTGHLAAGRRAGRTWRRRDWPFGGVASLSPLVPGGAASEMAPRGAVGGGLVSDARAGHAPGPAPPAGVGYVCGNVITPLPTRTRFRK